MIVCVTHDAYWKRVRVWVRCSSECRRAEQKSRGVAPSKKKGSIKKREAQRDCSRKGKGKEHELFYHSIHSLIGKAPTTPTVDILSTFSLLILQPYTTSPPHNTFFHEFHRHRGNKSTPPNECIKLEEHGPQSTRTSTNGIPRN